MTEPTFALDEDGRHVWWHHDCIFTMPPPKPDEPFRARTLLPLGPQHWTVTQTDPLTVTPSIQCSGCGTHGFITAGAWVSV